MKRSLTLAVLIALLSGCGAGGMDRYRAADLAIVNAQVVDLDRGSVGPQRMIVIAGGAIVDVAPSDPGRLGPEVRIIDASGRYALPGLWDTHVHIFQDVDDAVERRSPLLIGHGVTHVRDMASNLDRLTAARARLDAEPELIAPHIIAAGPLLESEAFPWYGDLLLVVDSPEAARREAVRLAEAGVDFFKAYGALEPDVYAALHAEANRLGLAVDGHVPIAVGLQGAAEAGQRTIEHLDIPMLQTCTDEPQAWFRRSLAAKFQEGYDAYYAVLSDFFDAIDWTRCARAFETLAETGGYVTPTLVMEMNDRSRVDEAAIDWLAPDSADWCRTLLAGVDAADPEAREAAYAAIGEALEIIRASGVALLAGSDTPNNCLAPGASLHWELERLYEAGLSRVETLRAATVTPAEAFGFEGRFGRIAPGHEADIVLFDADPLAGPPGLPAGVFTQGRWFDRSRLAALREDARIAQP